MAAENTIVCCHLLARDFPTADYLWPGAPRKGSKSLVHPVELWLTHPEVLVLSEPVATRFPVHSLTGLYRGRNRAATGWSLGLDQTTPAQPL